MKKKKAVEVADDLEYIKINVDWRKSYYGNSANVEIWTNSGYYKGRAGGCGYDKESSAIATAFNQSNEILKILYTLAEKMIKENGEDVYYYTGCGDCISWRNSIGYGSGYYILPYFEGGVGVSCFESILNKCNFVFSHVGSGKTWDCYYIYKKGEK